MRGQRRLPKTSIKPKAALPCDFIGMWQTWEDVELSEIFDHFDSSLLPWPFKANPQQTLQGGATAAKGESDGKAMKKGSSREVPPPASSKRSSQSSEQATPPESGARGGPAHERGERSAPKAALKPAKKESGGKDSSGELPSLSPSFLAFRAFLLNR